MKKTACSVGIILGIVIIVIGFFVQGITIETSATTIGSYMRFGADFYTEMYAVTQDVGYAVNGTKRAIADAAEGICDAIGWLMVAFGLFDIGFFFYKNAEHNDPEAPVTISTTPITAQPSATATSSARIFTSPESTSRISNTSGSGQWICTCGRCNADYISSCVCGATKSDVKLQHVAPVSATVHDGQMYCPKCGTAQRIGRKVCFSCGQPFDN